MSGQKQHVDYRRKLELRNRFLAHAADGPVYVPFIGDGDLASDLYQGREIYGVDIDPDRVATARERLPDANIVEGDADKWHFDTGIKFAVADFDAYANPYPAIQSFLKNSELHDPVVLFGTDGRLQRVKRAKVGISFPKGDGHDDWRKVMRYYWTGYAGRWLESVLPFPIQKHKMYSRGAAEMRYWAIVVGSHPIPSENGGGMGEPFGSERLKRSDARLVEQAIKKRWPVDESKKGPLIDALFEIAVDNLAHPAARVAAARGVIAAEAQNQADEHKATPDQLDVNVTQILKDDDWYGNASRIAAAGASPSDSDSDGPAQIQAPSVRPAVGENGNGAPGNGSGPR